MDLVAAPHHRVGERERLAARKPLEEDGHEERRELIVGDVAEDELVDLGCGQLVAVALALDEIDDAAHFVATKIVMCRVTASGSSNGGMLSAKCV